MDRKSLASLGVSCIIAIYIFFFWGSGVSPLFLPGLLIISFIAGGVAGVFSWIFLRIGELVIPVISLYFRQHWRKWLISIFILVVIMFVIWASFLRFQLSYGWAGWTGFGESEKILVPPPPGAPTINYIPPKTLWDLLGLIIIPVFLGFGAYWLNKKQRQREIEIEDDRAKREFEIAEKRAKTDRDISADQLQEARLQTYFEKMAEWLSSDSSPRRKIKTEVWTMVKARTITTLGSINGNRKGILIRFLAESRLLDGSNPSFNINGADLRGAKLQNIQLAKIELNEVDLRDSDLQNATMNDSSISDSDLMNANLEGINLQNAKLYRSDLRNAKLQGSNLEGVELQYCNLRGAILIGVDLEGANLEGANLSEANLFGANLSKANLKDAKLDHANLRAALLRRANMERVNFRNANLENADLRYSVLTKAVLLETNLNMALLESSDLRFADMRYAKLVRAFLLNADLRHADLGFADLKFANFTDANLLNSKLLPDQLDKVVSLRGATLPDGTLVE